MKTECEHKFVYTRTDNFYALMGRYSKKYTSISYYFCEKCLVEKLCTKNVVVGDHEEIPDWAKTITTRVAGYE
jgi:hypothetical protein